MQLRACHSSARQLLNGVAPSAVSKLSTLRFALAHRCPRGNALAEAGALSRHVRSTLSKNPTSAGAAAAEKDGASPDASPNQLWRQPASPDRSRLKKRCDGCRVVPPSRGLSQHKARPSPANAIECAIKECVRGSRVTLREPRMFDDVVSVHVCLQGWEEVQAKEAARVRPRAL